MPCTGVYELALNSVENAKVKRQALHVPFGCPTLGAVDTRRGETQWREQIIELTKRASRNDRNGYLADVQVLKCDQRARWNENELRARLYLSQRAIDVEEKSAAPDL